jgi:hypothetical protein
VLKGKNILDDYEYGLKFLLLFLSFLICSQRSNDDPNRQRIICDLLLLLVYVKNNNMFGYFLDDDKYKKLIGGNDKYFFSLNKNIFSQTSISYCMSKKEIPSIFLQNEMNIDEDDVNVITTLSYFTLSSFSSLYCSEENENYSDRLGILSTRTSSLPYALDLMNSRLNKITRQFGMNSSSTPFLLPLKKQDLNSRSITSLPFTLKKGEHSIKSNQIYSLFSVHQLLSWSGLECFSMLI